jgi:HlyD family secretion protein
MELSSVRHGQVTLNPFTRDMKKRSVIVLIAFTVIAAASGAAYYQTTGGESLPQFATAQATRGDVVEVVEVTGKLEAVTTVQVGTQVSGTIQSLHADFNSKVRKGQVIARLDASVLKAQVDQAEATLARLQAEVERARVQVGDANLKLRRAKQLSEKGLIPATDLETAETTAREASAALKAAEAQVVQAHASLNQARVNLSHTVITAPVDGIVISRSVDVGQTVAASMSAPTLFVIAKDLAEMQVSASVDEADIGRIEPGQKVTFKVDAYPAETFRGTVSQVRLEPVVAQNVVSYVTIIDVPNRDLKLKPGMTANVTVEVARADNVVRVPNAALRFVPTEEMLASIQRTDNQMPDSGTERGVRPPGDANRRPADAARVWALENGQLHPIRVRTGVNDGLFTAIVGGELPEGAIVVTGVASSAGMASANQPASSPLIPRRPGVNRQSGSNARPQGANR